jgi:hypothetical protein
MADTDTHTVAAAWPYVIALGGLVVGAMSPVAAYVTTRLQLSHDIKLAREDRMFTARREAYVDLLRFVHVTAMRVERTYPIMSLSSDPEPPAPPSDETIITINALIGALGSAEVQGEVREFRQAVNKFYGKASGLHVAMSQAGASDNRTLGLWQDVEKFREVVRDKAGSVADVVAADLMARSSESA